MKIKFKKKFIIFLTSMPISFAIFLSPTSAISATAATSATTAAPAKAASVSLSSLSSSSSPSSSEATAGLALATSKNCLSCHAVARKLVGPAFKDVAAKYAGKNESEQNDAVKMLANKVMKGGGGVWGPVPMPSNNQVNAEEAKKLVEWVLSAH